MRTVNSGYGGRRWRTSRYAVLVVKLYYRTDIQLSPSSSRTSKNGWELLLGTVPRGAHPPRRTCSRCSSVVVLFRRRSAAAFGGLATVTVEAAQQGTESPISRLESPLGRMILLRTLLHPRSSLHRMPLP